MLLIAQPKTASTSFMHSLAEIMKVPFKNGHNRKAGDVNCQGYEQLQIYHGTMVKRSKAYLKAYIENGVLYKEHILPTPEHLKYIEEVGKPVVVQIRNPAECIASYKRVLSVIPDKQIDFDVMEKELELFRETYLQLTNNEIYMIIDYKDIVEDFTETVKKVIKHYGRAVPTNVDQYKLQKRNYTWSR